jgi:peroxiredoxin/uncharacterized membrane protein YphA (DoxX/SURF4 family)
MGASLLIARLLLALVFATAGVAKLADRAGSRRAIVDFGVPASLAAPLGILLPLAELAVAAALIPPATAWWGALGALALLILFVAGISFNLARGHKPECNCFGQLRSTPVGWKTLARNGIFTVVAGFVLWQGSEDADPSISGWLGSLTTAQFLGLVVGLLVLVLLAAQGWFLIHLLRQNGRMLVRLEALESRIDPASEVLSENGTQPAEGLPVGSPAPPFDLKDIYGETRTLDSLRASGNPLVLLFTDPDCGPCTALLPEIGRWQRDHTDEVTIALVSRGSLEENRAKSTEHGIKNVLLQQEWEVVEAYEVLGTPSAVLVHPNGTIGGPLATSPEEIEVLVAQAAGVPAQETPCPDCGEIHTVAPVVPMGKKLGEPAPPLRLPDLSGKSIELANFKGSETLLLFWSPNCGFCNLMLDDLKAIEANPPKGAPKLLVISEGTVEANEAMGLRSPVVLDEKFSAGWEFGADGTPSAVLIDAEGNVASEVVVGAPAVLDLARAGRSAV